MSLQSGSAHYFMVNIQKFYLKIKHGLKFVYNKRVRKYNINKMTKQNNCYLLMKKTV